MKCMPVLATNNMKEQMEFYQALGFEVVTYLTRPMPYGVLKFRELEFHTYSSKKHVPEENPMMTFIQIEDLETLEEINELFTCNLKANYGRIPRSGFPRIKKINELKEDFRFTMADVGGNHLYFIVAKKENEVQFFREVENDNIRKMYQLAYDFLYSKMDMRATQAAMVKLDEQIEDEEIVALDRVKIALMKLSFAKELGETDTTQAKIVEEWLEENLHVKERSRIHGRYQTILAD